jgi:hypothetical protein
MNKKYVPWHGRPCHDAPQASFLYIQYFQTVRFTETPVGNLKGEVHSVAMHQQEVQEVQKRQDIQEVQKSTRSTRSTRSTSFVTSIVFIKTQNKNS